MFNAVIDTLTEYLENQTVLSEFTIFDNVFMPLFEGNSQLVFQEGFINRFPAMCFDFTINRERMNVGFKRIYQGRLVVAVMALDMGQGLVDAGRDLDRYIDDTGYILDILFATPTPVISGTNIHLRQFEIGAVQQGNFKQKEDGENFFISKFIPLSFHIIY